MKQEFYNRLYAGVPVEQVGQLRAFRTNHPGKTLDCEGKSWNYIECGQGEKVLLFLAGGFLRADMWFYPIAVLEKNYRILATDSYLIHGLSIHDATKALPRVLKSEGVDKASVIGISAGGGLAQLLVQEHPEYIEHLVLSHTGITGILENSPEFVRQTQRLLKLVKILPLSAIRRILVKRTSGTIPISSQWRTFHNAYFREASSSIQKAMVICLLQDAIEVRQGYIFQPEMIANWHGKALILSSKDDRAMIGSVDRLKERFPQARVHLFEEGGHHTFMLYPEIYTTILKSFLDQFLQ